LGFRPRFFIEVVALVALDNCSVVFIKLSTVGDAVGSSVFLFVFFLFCAVVVVAVVAVVAAAVVVAAVVAAVVAVGLAARFFGVDFISGAGAAVSVTAVSVTAVSVTAVSVTAAVAAFLTLDGIVEKYKNQATNWLFIIHHVCQTF
jgi:hypothetical protein